MDAICVHDAVAEYLKGNTRALHYLLNTMITAKSFPPACKLFFSDCQSILHTFTTELAIHFFHIFLKEKPWYTFDADFNYQCASMLIGLALNHPHLITELCASFAKVLFACDLTNIDVPENELPLYCFSLVSKCIQLLLEIVPQAETQLMNSLKQGFPTWRSSTIECFSASSNCLGLLIFGSIKFKDSSTLLVFDIVCNLLLELESNTISINNISFRFLDSIQNAFDYTVFDESKTTALRLILADQTENDQTKIEIILWLLIGFLWQKCPENTSKGIRQGKLEWNQLCALFRSLRTHFMQEILPVRSEFAAFPVLLLFLCSLRQGFIVSFVENLWKLVKDIRQTAEFRIRSLSYLTDYLARGTHCSRELIYEQVYDMAIWCVEYTYFHREKQSPHNDHQLFYIVFEAVIYIVTYRHASLLDSSVSRDAFRLLPIGQLINCPLRPLRFVRPELGSLFYVVSSAYKFNWSIIVPAQLSEMVLPDVSESTSLQEVLSSHVKPSFSCPFFVPVVHISPLDSLNLFQKFLHSKRFFKYLLRTCSDMSVKRRRLTSCHFDFQALEELHNHTPL